MSNLCEGRRIMTAPVARRSGTQGAARVLLEVHPLLEATGPSHLPWTGIWLRELPVGQGHLFSSTSIWR